MGEPVAFHQAARSKLPIPIFIRNDAPVEQRGCSICSTPLFITSDTSGMNCGCMSIMRRGDMRRDELPQHHLMKPAIRATGTLALILTAAFCVNPYLGAQVPAPVPGTVDTVNARVHAPYHFPPLEPAVTGGLIDDIEVSENNLRMIYCDNSTCELFK